MSSLGPASLSCLLVWGLLLSAAPRAAPAWAQTAAPPAPAPKPRAAAPRAPVHQAGKPVPVVHPHGTTHAVKPPAKPASPPAAPAAPPPATPPPAAPPKPPEAENKGSNTGLSLPRFAAFRSDEVNLRAGPGTRYPIDWIYKRRDLPVEILREFEVWRLVQDPDGIKGWVHQATLTGRRSFIVKDADATMRRGADDKAAAVAILKPGVIGHIRSCAGSADWCAVQVGDYRGYLPRSAMWGTLPGEAVNE